MFVFFLLRNIWYATPVTHFKSLSLSHSLFSIAPSMEEKPASKPVEGAPPASGKIWERPWSIAEMKEGSKDWKLASDAGVSHCTKCI